MIDELSFMREARPEVPRPLPQVVSNARKNLRRETCKAGSRKRRNIRIAAVIGAAAVTLFAIGLVGFNGLIGSQNASAAILNKSADIIDSQASPEPGEFRYTKEVETTWNFGLQVETPDGQGTTGTVLETWIPGDQKEIPVERLTGADGKVVTTPSSTDNNPSIYLDHSDEPAGLLDELRVFAGDRAGGSDADSVWRASFGLVLDAQAPNELKADVFEALSLMKEVKVVDKDVKIGGARGVALGIDTAYAPQLVFNDKTSVFIGARGFPEPGPHADGRYQPMYTVVLESKIVKNAPDV